MSIIGNIIFEIAQILSALVGYVALGIVIVGLGTVAVEGIKIFSSKKKSLFESLNHIRLKLGLYLLLALEFLIAKDVILTIFDPSLSDLIILSVIIAIRVILSYFLHRELKDIKLHRVNGGA